jgi:ribonuclease R
MLLANEAVAGRLMGQNRKAIYRVHEEPDERRLQEYREEVLSHNVPCGNLSKPQEVQKLMQRLRNLAIGQALKIGFLKSLMRARYAVEPLGHYGLAKAKYTHFTSPIRRYADLVVHRSLAESGAGSSSSLKGIADHISDTERNSADAERDSKDVKMYAFLRAQLRAGTPTRYPALVIDTRNFGFFVDVPDLSMSGLVHLSSLEDDFYVFDAGRGLIMGRRSRRVIRMGDTVEVEIAKVDTFKKQVDFRLAGGREAGRGGGRGRGRVGRSRGDRRSVAGDGPDRSRTGDGSRGRARSSGTRDKSKQWGGKEKGAVHTTKARAEGPTVEKARAGKQSAKQTRPENSNVRGAGPNKQKHKQRQRGRRR